MSLPRPKLLALALSLAACGGGSGPALQVGAWAWVDVAGTACSDGSSTGLAVNLGPAGSTELVLFLDGGGACWDAFTCESGYAETTAFGRADFEARLASGVSGTILDRGANASLFAHATLVFIPYCTGDVHWGDNVVDYPPAGAWHFHGRPNLDRDVTWLFENLPAPARLVVSGSSAGGYGALLAHDLARTAWPDSKGYLIDDSGPPLVGDAMPPADREMWFSAWGLEGTLSPLCEILPGSPDCRADLSLVVDALLQKYPDDRVALVSSLEDGTIAAFTGQTGAEFETALLELVSDRIDPNPKAGAFLVAGGDHALLQRFESYSSGDLTLSAWLGQMLGDDPGWSTVGR